MIDIVGAARGVGIAVQSARLSERLDGCLAIDGDVSLIVVNSRLPLSRARFTVAHEYAHWVLHRRFRPSFCCDRGVSEPMEHQADGLAAELLMPADEVCRLAYACPFMDMLAREFGVSEDAMRRRLRDLRIRLPRFPRAAVLAVR